MTSVHDQTQTSETVSNVGQDGCATRQLVYTKHFLLGTTEHRHRHGEWPSRFCTCSFQWLQTASAGAVRARARVLDAQGGDDLQAVSGQQVPSDHDAGMLMFDCVLYVFVCMCA